MTTHLDLRHDRKQDRMRLSTREAQVLDEWWLTRSLLLRWISSWLQQLETIPLPDLPAPLAARMNPRDLAQEHALSIEDEGPRASTPPDHDSNERVPALLEKISTTLSPLDCRLELIADKQKRTLTLTRREAHCLLEMLALASRRAGWLDKPAWPSWLGQAQVST